MCVYYINHVKSMYKLSHYNYVKKRECDYIIYNTFSGAIIILTNDEYMNFANYNGIEGSAKDLNKWINLGLVINKDIDERKIIEYCRFKDTFTNKDAVYRILTTTSCNAKCFYCYEERFNVASMTMRSANAIADFIVRNSIDKKKVVLSWFGGEPLLNADMITLITKRVTNGLKDYNIKINSSLITNGSLFTDKLINEAKNIWKLNAIQISLDGKDEVHDRRKNYNNINNSFDKTIEIISKLLDSSLYVTIRLNFDKSNFENIKILIPYLRETFGNNKNLHCYCYPIFNKDSHSNSDFINKSEINYYMTEILHVLKENLFKESATMPKRTKNSCFAVNPNSFVFDPKGNIYKCCMVMEGESHCIGNVYEDIKLSNSLIRWCSPTLPYECSECNILPLCQGGCRASRIQNLEQNYCEIKKSILDFYLENYI